MNTEVKMKVWDKLWIKMASNEFEFGIYGVLSASQTQFVQGIQRGNPEFYTTPR